MEWKENEMASIFTKIINGELPCYKIYEDEKTLAFLNINPEARGDTLVVPKVEIDKVYDLADEDYSALWFAVKKVAKHMEEVTGRRTIMKVIGKDVAHAHVHVMPLDDSWEEDRIIKMSDEELKEACAELAF